MSVYLSGNSSYEHRTRNLKGLSKTNVHFSKSNVRIKRELRLESNSILYVKTINVEGEMIFVYCLALVEFSMKVLCSIYKFNSTLLLFSHNVFVKKEGNFRCSYTGLARVSNLLLSLFHTFSSCFPFSPALRVASAFVVRLLRKKNSPFGQISF